MAADQGRAATGDRRSQINEPPGPYRTGETLDLKIAGLRPFEPVGEGVPHRFGDEDLAGFGRIGEARGEIYCFARQFVFAVNGAAGSACHDLPAGNPDVYANRMPKPS